MKALTRLLLALAATTTLTAPVQADTLYGALREGTAVRVSAGLIPRSLPPGTTDALRYIPRPPVGSLHEVSHRAPAGTTDRFRQLAGQRSPSSVSHGGTALVWTR